MTISGWECVELRHKVACLLSEVNNSVSAAAESAGAGRI
jgi:hypothetical protein